jgi:two-component system chemotaxis response regulator CheY|tara:strand:+ start:193 stop:567 length:375 start_codon:yes stop_codon:yes gene_type:complete
MKMSNKILIVDDSATVRQQVGLALQQAGFETVEANDGVQGLEAVQADASIAAVICDVNMPRMNGLDMVRAVKAQGRFADLPIVMLTTEGQPSLIREAREAGAKGWIIKPFKAVQLVAAVQKLTA